MKKEYMSPMIGAEVIACGVILDGSPVAPITIENGGQQGGLSADAPVRKGNPLNGQIRL